MSKIKLTEPMADELRRGMGGYLRSSCNTNTAVALIRRGLAEPSHTGRNPLTRAGKNLRRYLIAGGDTRSFDPTQLHTGGFPLDRVGDLVRAQIELEAGQEKRASLFSVGVRVQCVSGQNKGRFGTVAHTEHDDRAWAGVVRDGHPNAGLRYVSVEWDARPGDMGADRRGRPFVDEIEPVTVDDTADRLTLEEALAEAHTEWRTGEPAVVRIRYVGGTTEECRNIPTGEIAFGIYAEACGNDRVMKAELVLGDGTVAALYAPAEPHHPLDPGA